MATTGFAVVNVAAMEMLKGDHSVLSRELRRYTRESLERLLTDAGFTFTHPELEGALRAELGR